MTPEQCRAARAMTGLDADDLAARAAVPHAAVTAFEAGGSADEAVVAALRGVLERQGILFIDDAATSAAGGPGLRLSATPGKARLKDVVQYPEFLSPDASTGSGG